MGPTPPIDGPIGQVVLSRMRREGKVVGDQVRYARGPDGRPLPPGQFHWYGLGECEMGHVIDAVNWWNTNGRFTGPQSKEVQKFMTDPNNYEIEPAIPNRLRGSALASRQVNYLPSTQ
jgi:hypothetical protein